MSQIANTRGPLGLKQPTDKPNARASMRRVSKKREAKRREKGFLGLTGPEYMAHVAELPCVITGRRPVIVHHCIHGRYSTARASDFDTIPLVPELHDHGHPGALHSGKETWAALHGPDYSFIEQTRKRVKEMLESVVF